MTSSLGALSAVTVDTIPKNNVSDDAVVVPDVVQGGKSNVLIMPYAVDGAAGVAGGAWDQSCGSHWFNSAACSKYSACWPVWRRWRCDVRLARKKILEPRRRMWRHKGRNARLRWVTRSRQSQTREAPTAVDRASDSAPKHSSGIQRG